MPGIKTLEDKIYDFRLNTTLPRNKDPRVVILDIDEKSLKDLGRWPWNRELMANIMNILFDEYFVQTIGLDILFAEEDDSSGLIHLKRLADGPLKNNPDYIETLSRITPSLDYDQLFAKSMTDRDVIMGFFFRNQAQEQIGDFNIGQLPPPVPIENSSDVGQFLTHATGYGANLSIFQNEAIDGGFIDNPSISPDGIIRKVPLIQKFEGQIYQSLSLALIRALYGFPPIKLEYTENNVLVGISMDETFIPTTYKGEVYVPYRGDFPSYTYLSVSDVLNKKINPEILDGAIVLMGTSATGLLDMRATPVNNIFPGVEIHANVISGILDNAIKYEPFDLQGLDFMLHLIIGIIMIFALPLLKVFASIAVTSLFLGSMVILNFYFWQEMQMIMPVVSILILITFNFILHISYGYFVEDRNKRKLAGLFGQYVPPELVDEMSKSSDSVSLEGETKELTILFSDIRGFTTLSETMEPKDLTSLMNQYLTVMTQIILNNRGTIDKYIGDAIMAFWGAPLSDENHASHAVQAAADMQAAIPALNKKFADQGFPSISIGIGLNTGKVNVGNMGSEFRMAYTVLGDEVNLASRLESITKQYKTDLIVSENTKEQAPEWIYQELDLVKVVGKNIPISIFHPIARKSEIDKLQQKEMYLFKVAVKLYRQQQWQDARNILDELCQLTNNRFLYNLYLERIKYYENNPPGESWDGVYEATSK